MADLQSSHSESGRTGRVPARASGRRLWMLRALAVLIGVSVPVGCLEVLLWSLPVYGGTRTLAVNEHNPVIRFQPDREFVWSRDWDFSIVNHVRINNFGFVSDFDYDPHAAGPLLAVIGDSYVEALMVPFGQTCAGRLAAALAGRARVYAFGVSGSPLSQYLAFAEYVRDRFQPAGLAIVVIENDYHESLRKYGRLAGKHQFVEQSEGRLHLERADLERTLLQRLIRASALARYFAGNADVRHVGQQVRHTLSLWWAGLFGGEEEREPSQLAGGGEGEPSRVAGGAERERASVAGNADGEALLLADSKRAVGAFLDRLPAASGLDPERIVFVVDGLRPQVYREDQLAEMAGSFRDVMRRYFMAGADRRGYGIADLQPAMVTHYRAHREPFEWPQDFHWNALGHEMCFDAVAGSVVVSEGLPAPGGSDRGGFTERVHGAG